MVIGFELACSFAFAVQQWVWGSKGTDSTQRGGVVMGGVIMGFLLCTYGE